MGRISFADDIGSLVVNFGVKGGRREVIESDALVIITLADGKIADIQILLDSKEAIKKLATALKEGGNMKPEIDEKVLEDFLHYSCDGFENIKVVKKKPLTLLFKTWGSDVFLLEVGKIEKVRGD